MKTVAQWAEQLPELIKIEFLYETEKQEVSNRILVNPSATINAIIWIDTFLGTDFWHGVASCFYETPKSADYIDESVPYTKSEVDAMILEYADPNDEVCKVMLANVGKTKEATLANQLTYEALSLSNKNLIIEIGEITKENEALKSTIEGLASENAQLISETQRLNHLVETQKVEITELENNNHELLEQIKPTPQPKTSLLQRFNNWIS